MRAVAGAVLFMVLIAGAAHPEMTACQLLERTDLEQITSAKFDMAQSERLDVCAGLCDGINGWRCLYQRTDGTGNIFIDVNRPPFFFPPGLDKYRQLSSGDADARVSDVPDLPGIWYFSGDKVNGRGILKVDDDLDSARLTIVVEGEGNDQALSAARGIAQLVVSRLHGG